MQESRKRGRAHIWAGEVEQEDTEEMEDTEAGEVDGSITLFPLRSPVETRPIQLSWKGTVVLVLARTKRRLSLNDS
jgi:hypothetical protein